MSTSIKINNNKSLCSQCNNNKQINHLIYKDPNISINNMRGLYKYTLKQNGVSFILFFIDICNFKQVNDNYGHICGNFILNTIASRLKKLVRKQDYIARFGGDEFIFLIKYSKYINPTNIIKRISLHCNTTITYKNIVFNIKLNIGYSKLKINKLSNTTHILNAINKADKYMYSSKKQLTSYKLQRHDDK